MKKSFAILLCCILTYMILAGNLLAEISSYKTSTNNHSEVQKSNETPQSNLEIIYNSNAKLLNINYLGNKKINSIKVIAANGQKVFEQIDECKFSTFIDTNSFAEGIYSVNLINENAEQINQKVFIKN